MKIYYYSIVSKDTQRHISSPVSTMGNT